MALITWNPNDKGSLVILSNNNLTTKITGNTSSAIRTPKYVNSGSWYFEVTIDKENETWNRSTMSIGITNDIFVTNDSFNRREHCVYYSGAGTINKVGTKYGEIFKIGDVIGVAFNCNNNTIQFSRNGNWFEIITMPQWDKYNPFIMQTATSGTDIATVNFGSSAFKYKIPKGYTSYDESQSNINKYLLKNNNHYYSVKPEYYSNNQYNLIPELEGKNMLTKEDYETYGFNDLNILTQNTTINSETFRPIDKLQRQFDDVNILQMKWR